MIAMPSGKNTTRRKRSSSGFATEEELREIVGDRTSRNAGHRVGRTETCADLKQLRRPPPLEEHYANLKGVTMRSMRSGGRRGTKAPEFEEDRGVIDRVEMRCSADYDGVRARAKRSAPPAQV
jgi:hypothetical protein